MRRMINIEDLTGREFGKLKVIERDYSKQRKNVEHYRCECKCGNNNYITTAKDLLSGKRSCGCIRKTKGFNDYKVNGEITTIYFTNRLDEIIMEGYIDTEDLPRLIKQNFHWCAGWNECIQDYYAFATEYRDDENGIRKQICHSLNRDIMNAPTGTHVDHIKPENHGTLNNRKSNLRITDCEHNSKHKNGKNKNNKSGFRNVSKRDKWWVVQLQIEGKNTVLKKFPLDQLKDAGAYAEKMRQLYYGEFAGIS